MWGRRKPMGNGELGREDGVSGLVALSRVEWQEALDEGREIGRRVGVKNKNGTPVTSSRCLCMRSRTCCSSWQGRSEEEIDCINEPQTVSSSTPSEVLSSSLSSSSRSSPRSAATFVTRDVVIRVNSSSLSSQPSRGPLCCWYIAESWARMWGNL